jgi:heme oxygenase
MLVDALAAERTHAETPPTLRDKLKQATASAHRSLDELFSSFDLTAVGGYRRFLEANAAALFPLEAALDDAGVATMFPDWPARSRRAAILADLDGLDGAVLPLGDVAPLDRNSLLGVMYVLEGSRLGAKFLLRGIADCGDTRITAATHYLSHGAGLKLWPTFLQKLEGEAIAPEDEAEIIAGAHLAFAMFAEAAALT